MQTSERTGTGSSAVEAAPPADPPGTADPSQGAPARAVGGDPTSLAKAGTPPATPKPGRNGAAGRDVPLGDFPPASDVPPATLAERRPVSGRAGAATVEAPAAPPREAPARADALPAEPQGRVSRAAAPPEPQVEPAARATAPPAPTREAPPAAPPAPGPAPAGRETAAPTVPSVRRRNLRVWLLVPLFLVAATIAGTVAYRYWYEDTHFVTTENASIAGPMVQFGALQAGRVVAVNVDVGTRVRRDQEVATVALPAAVGATSTGSSRLTFTGTDDDRVPVRAPSDGVVVARLSNPGDTVQAGQAMLAIVDPTQFWVQANIEETKVGRLQVGQVVEVWVDSLRRSLPGRVQAVTPATAGTFSLLPPQNTTGNFNKVTQVVPVKIALDYAGEPLVLGSSVVVRIHVTEPE